MRKYLSELLYNAEYDSKNLIIAPTGSGKTNYIFVDLIQKFDRVLYLCDTTALRQSIIKQARVEHSNLDVMCYNTFGKMFKNGSDCIEFEWDCIICDEFHNLFCYDNAFNNANTTSAIINLMREDGCKKFYFTATPDVYNERKDSKGVTDVFENVKVFDYSESDEIVRYNEKHNVKLNSWHEIVSRIDIHKDLIAQESYKVLIFTQKIDTQVKLQEQLNQIDGINALCLWSINSKNIMSDEQIQYREYLLENEKLPDDKYNVLIINKAMETGINIKDKSFQYCFLNTTDETERVQARGRLRHNITYLFHVDKNNCDYDKSEDKGFIAKYLNKKLSATDKKELCSESGMIDAKGRNIGWTRMKKVIEDLGYSVKDISTRIDGVNTRVSIIS